MNPILIAAPTSNEVLIAAPDARGEALAHAIGGRVAGTGWLLTPVRAEKWAALYAAGFTARRIYCGGPIRPWRYVRGDERLTLAAAIKAATPQEVTP